MFSSRVARTLFWIVLIGYAVFKYMASAPDGVSLPYMATVALIVLLTAVIPFVVARSLGLNVAGHRTRTLATVAIGVILSVLGYSAFWAFAIQPSGAEVSLWDVARRGIPWGLAFGGLAAVWNSAYDD